MANRSSHSASIAINTKAAEAIDRYLAEIPTLKIGGKTFTPAELKARLQAESDAVKALATARAGLRQQVIATQRAKDIGKETRASLRAWLIGTYGISEVKMLEEFGFKPGAPTPRTVEAKTAAVAKAKATRLARHIMGRQQRLAIKAPAQPAAPVVPADGH